MKIGIVATHSFPIPTPTHTGDIVILDLARALDALGHTVTLYAPEGTDWPRLCPMPCSFGKAPPWSQDCEQACFDRHTGALLGEDIVHDFSVTKRIAERLLRAGRPVISTLLGGQWAHPDPPRNIVVWSNAMRERGLRGATDYENTPLEHMGGPPQQPIKDARVIAGGIDTSWYVPDYAAKRGFYLWMNRWHPAKGYTVAIELARKTGVGLVMAGEHPDNEMFDYQRQCALESRALASNMSNVRFEWLPPDPHHHEAKRKLYQQAKALLYTVQFQEPFGLSQVEALACGTPVIGLRFGSVPEVIRSGVTGIVCDDIEEMARVLRNPAGRIGVDRIIPETCRADAVARFDRRVMAQAYVRAYEDVIAGREWG